ncbi:DUF2523 domain-containing protein [Paracidovorax wautersii]|uniref:DUF2523 domain-containing protein n=1 Tax=Paracidovorax wautersii TaxID=1177982 RepID=UPI0031D4A606
MPTFVAAIGGMLLNLAGSLAGQVLLSLGIAVVTYTGTDAALDKLKADALGAMSGMPRELVALLAYMKVGVAMSIIFSAVAVRLSLSGMSGAVKRFRKK